MAEMGNLVKEERCTACEADQVVIDRGPPENNTEPSGSLIA
jgi:hypothetical protein